MVWLKMTGILLNWQNKIFFCLNKKCCLRLKMRSSRNIQSICSVGVLSPSDGFYREYIFSQYKRNWDAVRCC